MSPKTGGDDVERKIQKVEFQTAAFPKLLRVAAYARVSSGKDAMHQSLSAQISYYSGLIQRRPEWQFAGVYADEAKTGTKDTRAQFRKLIEECRAGQIDCVITKSISRFARNTLTLLETVRLLKHLGIDVFFEEQNIHTLSADGELLLTLLASFAQEESQSASENQKWRIQKNFEQGVPWCREMLGYRYRKGKYVVVPEEAAVVQRVFSEYLNGAGVVAIVNGLNRDGILTRKGFTWHTSVISKILRNYTYTGNLLLQRFYSENHLTKRKCINQGELPMYHVAETHEAIIPMDVFEATQAEIKRRSEKYAPKKEKQEYPLSGKIVCGGCGKSYRRKKTAGGPVWICTTYNTKGKAYCVSKAVPERVILDLLTRMPAEQIERIEVLRDNELRIRMQDGTEKIEVWRGQSRASSWTPEMREKARMKTLERRQTYGECHSDPGKNKKVQ